MQESALLFALTYVADHPADFLSSLYLKSKRSTEKARPEGPAAWVIQNDGKRPALAAQLAALLQQEGCKVQTLDSDLQVIEQQPASAAGQGGTAPRASAGTSEKAATAVPATRKLQLRAGSYVIRMDQPYSRIADMLLDTQYYNTNDPRPYDDTGWTLGALRNVPTVRVTDQAVLAAPMKMVNGAAKAVGNMSGSGSKYFLVNANAKPALASLRYRLRDAHMFAAEDPVEVDRVKYSSGTIVIPVDGNAANLQDELSRAATDLGLRVVATASDVKGKRHELRAAGIALMHTWVNTQNEGWYRLALDEMKVPYTYI